VPRDPSPHNYAVLILRRWPAAAGAGFADQFVELLVACEAARSEADLEASAAGAAARAADGRSGCGAFDVCNIDIIVHRRWAKLMLRRSTL